MAIPTPMSKVIPVNLDFKNSSISNWKPFNTGMGFWTNDIGTAFLEFSTELDLTGTVASIVLENQYDKSLVQKTITEITSSPFYYQLGDEIQHEGRWFVQISVKKGEETIVSNSFAFMVNASIGHGKVARLVSIETFETLATQLTALQTDISNYLETAETNEAIRVSTYDEIVLAEETRKETEDIREANDISRGATATADNTRANTDHSTAVFDHSTALTDHSTSTTDHTTALADHSIASSDHSTAVTDNTRANTDHITALADHTSYEGLLTDGVLATNIENKLLYLETTYAPELNSVKQQLADKIGGGVKAEPEDLSATTLGLVTGTGGPINLLTIPQDLSVTAEKTNYIAPDSNQNIFNPYLATDGYRLSTAGALTADAFYTSSTFIPVTNGKTYKIVTGGAATGRICGYNTSKVFNKVVISGLASGGTILVDFDGYIRVPVLLTLKFTTQIVDNSIYNGIFTPFEYAVADVMRSKPKKRSVTDDTVLNASLSYRKMDFISDGKNLFNPSSRTLNLLLSNLVSEYYDTTEYIPVKTGTTYTLNQARRYALYNIDKLIIGATVEKPDNVAVSVTPTQDGYMRASVSKALVDTFQIEIGNAVTAFEPYERRMTDLTIDVSDIKFDSLKGKKLLNLGDSIGYGSDVSYAFQLADKYGMVLTNRASGGASVSDEIPANNIQLQLSQAIVANDNPDIIFIDGGTNDLSYTAGTITPYFTTALNTSSFCGGLETIFKTIRTTWPQAMVIYIIPHCMRKSLTAMADVFGKGVQIAKKYGVPVVSIYEEGNLNTNFIPQSTLYTIDTYSTGEGDGTHPNELGYKKFYNPLIEAKLKAVMSTD